MQRVGEMLDDVLARAALVQIMVEVATQANLVVPKDRHDLPELEVAQRAIEFMVARPVWTLTMLASIREHTGDAADFKARAILSWLVCARSRDGLVVDGEKVLALLAPVGDA